MAGINDFIQKKIMPILLLITTGISIYNTIITNRQDVVLKSLEITSKNLENNQKDIEFIRKFKFDLYNEVKAAIISKDSILQRAAYDFVSQMLLDSTDETFRDALLITLKNSPTVSHAVQKEIQENFKYQKQFNSDEAMVIPTLSKTSFKIDIFYLEETQDISKKIAEELKNKLKDNYSVRIRILPKLINSKSSYKIASNEIRYEPSESNEAQQIVDIALNCKVSFVKHPIKYVTPNYISVFIKDGSFNNDHAE